jgi:hypothetical protein
MRSVYQSSERVGYIEVGLGGEVYGVEEIRERRSRFRDVLNTP